MRREPQESGQLRNPGSCLGTPRKNSPGCPEARQICIIGTYERGSAKGIT